MSRGGRTLIPVLPAAILLACSSCAPPPNATAPQVTAAVPSAEEPLEPVEPVDAEPDDAEAASHDDWLAGLPEIPKNPLAGCQQCHVDVEQEFIGSVHFNEDIACTDCHGPSEGHLADENNDVKPDELFARHDVDRLCSDCHRCARREEADPPGHSKVCTECHGWHAIVLEL